MELVDLVGFAAFINTFLIISSPFPALYEGIKKMEINNITLEYLLIGCLQSTLWSTYGHKNSDFYTSLTNDVLIVIFIIYLNMFFYINQMKDKGLYINIGIAIEIVLLYFFIGGNLCLLLASSMGTAWQFSMLRTMKKALVNKDSAFINLPIALLSSSGYVLWTSYAVLTSNWLMFIPNAIGCVMWGLNLFIFLWTKLYVNDDNFLICLLHIIFSTEKERGVVKGTPGEPLFNNLKTTFNNNHI